MLKPFAYGRNVAARRRNNERVGLLVVALHDWNSGMWFAHRKEVARVVLPVDVNVSEVDWSLVLALDVVICGSAPEPVFFEAAAAAIKAGAASVWWECSVGIQRLQMVDGEWCGDAPLAPEKLGAAIRRHRESAILLREGFYGSRIYASARDALIDSMSGLRELLTEHEACQ